MNSGEYLMNSKATIKIPNYTKGEEIFNMVTHIVGGGIGVVATALCVLVEKGTKLVCLDTNCGFVKNANKDTKE